MKLKARDIVSGWPRGRSTATCTDPWKYSLWWWAFCKHPTENHLQRKQDDLLLDRDYHFAQSQMVDRYRRTGWDPIMGSVLQLLVNRYMLVGGGR